MKDFNLSEKIRKRNNFEEIDVSDAKEFIRLLKEEILKNGVYEIETDTQRAGLVDVKKLFNTINKLAGDKLI